MNFPSLGAFSMFAARLAVREHALDTLGRGLVARFLEERIKDNLGTEFIQPPLAASTVERKGFDAPLIETGKMHDSIGWEHASVRKTIVGSTDEKAVWHEFGTGHVPARPFFSKTAENENKKMFEMYLGAVKSIGASPGSLITAALGETTTRLI